MKILEKYYNKLSTTNKLLKRFLICLLMNHVELYNLKKRFKENRKTN